jgi:hypothetical protein
VPETAKSTTCATAGVNGALTVAFVTPTIPIFPITKPEPDTRAVTLSVSPENEAVTPVPAASMAAAKAARVPDSDPLYVAEAGCPFTVVDTVSPGKRFGRVAVSTCATPDALATVVTGATGVRVIVSLAGTEFATRRFNTRVLPKEWYAAMTFGIPEAKNASAESVEELSVTKLWETVCPKTVSETVSPVTRVRGSTTVSTWSTATALAIVWVAVSAGDAAMANPDRNVSTNRSPDRRNAVRLRRSKNFE